jgi:hypothetical protein
MTALPKRPLFVFAAVLVLLYVLSVANGAAGWSAGCSPSPQTRQALRVSWLRPPSVSVEELELRGCSRAGAELHFESTCRISVGVSRRKLPRALTFTPHSPAQLDYRPRGEQAVPISATLSPGQSRELPVPPEGAVVLLLCRLPAQRCGLHLD